MMLSALLYRSATLAYRLDLGGLYQLLSRWAYKLG